MTNSKEVRKYVEAINGKRVEVIYVEYPHDKHSPEIKLTGTLKADFRGKDDLRGVTVILELTGTSRKEVSIPLRKIVSIKGVV